MATGYEVNYDDKRFTQVEDDKKEALSELEQTYSGMINKSDDFYNKQIEASKQWADEQVKLQNEQTDFAIQKIEQQREQAQKDYTKEQSGAYVDWRKQSNQYGAESEKMAASGLANTGFSESSQVSMYNTYQNRVAVAREAMAMANMNFDNGIREAKLQNNALIAEIKYKSYAEQLAMALEGFQYKNQLILDQAQKKTELNNTYYQRYQDVLKQINQENALAEEIRQYNASLAQQQAQLDEEKRQFDLQLKEEKRQFDAKNTGGGVVATGGSLSAAARGAIAGAGVGAGISPVGNKAAVSTAYYQGTANPDAKKYGTFSNGYQPKGISGHGKLSKSGQTMTLETQVQYGTDKGKKQTLVQTVWKAEDGSLWYWEGRQNKYIMIAAGSAGGGGKQFK